MKHFSKFFSGNHLSSPPEKSSYKPSPSKSNKQLDNELDKISSFIRSGLVVLSVILISGIAIGYGQQNLNNNQITTSGNRISNKKLPIYCVEQNEKKVALSFDAAWAERRILKKPGITPRLILSVTFSSML